MSPAAAGEARRRLDTRWTASPHPDLLALPEGEGRAYIFGFERGADWSGADAVAPLSAERAIRFAQGMAVTMRARGRGEDERAWLDVIALLDGGPDAEPA